MSSIAQRVLILVDEANFVGAARTFNRRADWLLLRDYLADPDEGRQLIEMIAYVGLPPDHPAHQRQRDNKKRFLHWLRTNGFLAVTKDGTPTEEGHYKANLDTIMAVDGVQLAIDTAPDIVVLVTGDGDFAHLAQTLRRRGIRVEAASVIPMLSAELRAAANGFVDLTPIVDRMPALNGDAAPIGSLDTL